MAYKMGKYLKILECPECKFCMRPPIYLCDSGHSYCNTCTYKSIKCKTCDKPVTDRIRNYLVEGFCKEVKYPCKYMDLGCSYHQRLIHLPIHEDEHCVFRPLTCPMNIIDKETICRWEGRYEQLKYHIINEHVNMMVIESYKHQFPGVNETPIFFMHCFEKLFQVCNEKGIYHVHLVGPGKDAPNFAYSASLEDVRHKNFNITVTNLCNERCRKDTDSNFKIFLPSETMKHIKITMAIKQLNCE